MGKVFITGPGRSGTSFLVQLLTRLGCDTGYEPGAEDFHDEVRAGCEIDIMANVQDDPAWKVRSAFEHSPRIIKGPGWAYFLKLMIQRGVVEIDHVVMPLRDLTDAASSRLSAGLDFLVDDDEFMIVTGGDKLHHQENVLAMIAGKVLEACYLYEIPLTLMHFPLIVEDEEYCYRKVSEFCDDINRGEFAEVWGGLADPQKIQIHQGAVAV
jgi:hypothetical protein